MILIYFVNFLIYFNFEKCFAFLNQAEESITVEFIKKHDIQNLILVEGNILNLDDVNKLKIVRRLKIPFLYVTGADLVEYFLKESRHYTNTLIAFKESDVRNVASVLNYLLRSRKYGYFEMCKWMLFTGRELSITEEQQLFIPYDCLFLIVYPKDPNFYSLKEIYQVKGRMFLLEYGTWSNDQGLIIQESFIYTRRFNLNGTALFLLNQNIGHCGILSWARECVNLQILADCARLMNVGLFNINQGPFADIFSLAAAFNYRGMPDEFGFLSPLFKISLNWYIRMPSSLEEADYYMRPFSYELWFCIFGFLIVGIAFGVGSYLFCRWKRIQIKILDLVFLALDNICSQDGSNGNKRLFCKIATLSFRLLALCLLSAYSGTILSYLAVRRLVLPFESLTEMVDGGIYKIAARNFTYQYNYFRDNNDPLITKIFENHFVGVVNYTKPFVEAMFCNEPVAFTGLDNDFDDLQPWCKIYRLKPPITYVLASIGIAKHSPFTRVFNYIQIRLFTSGIQQKLEKVLLREGIVKEEIESGFNSVPVSQMVQVLSIVPIGVITAVLIFLFELIWDGLRKFTKEQKIWSSKVKDRAIGKRRFRIVVNNSDRKNRFLSFF